MSIINSDVKVAVSSVLNRDVKQYGKKFMFDNNDDTCWNSDQGKDQWVKLTFAEERTFSNNLLLTIQFQGGFSCRVCTVTLLTGKEVKGSSTDCYPEDVNSIQKFDLQLNCDSNIKFASLKLQFKDTTDFFGRITVYYLDIIENS